MANTAGASGEAADMSVRPVNPLVRCPRCSSRLIAPCTPTAAHDGVIVDRRCPECDHRDRVVTTAFAAAVWARHETRVASSLHALADALADGAPVEVSEISARLRLSRWPRRRGGGDPRARRGAGWRGASGSSGAATAAAARRRRPRSRPSSASEAGVPTSRASAAMAAAASSASSAAAMRRSRLRDRREQKGRRVREQRRVQLGVRQIEHATEHVAELVVQRAAGRECLAGEPRARERRGACARVARLAQRRAHARASRRRPSLAAIVRQRRRIRPTRAPRRNAHRVHPACGGGRGRQVVGQLGVVDDQARRHRAAPCPSSCGPPR